MSLALIEQMNRLRLDEGDGTAPLNDSNATGQLTSVGQTEIKPFLPIDLASRTTPLSCMPHVRDEHNWIICYLDEESSTPLNVDSFTSHWRPSLNGPSNLVPPDCQWIAINRGRSYDPCPQRINELNAALKTLSRSHLRDGYITLTKNDDHDPTQQLPQHPESSSAQAQPISFHTPAKEIKAAASGTFRSASNVEERRTIIVSRDVPKMIPEISLQDHLFHVWPPVPRSLGGQVDNILKILEDNGTIDIPNDRSVAFPADPAQATGQEGAVFQGLTTIFNAVIAAAQQIDSSLEHTFDFIVNGNVAMYSDRGVSSRPDGFNKVYTKTREKGKSEQKQVGTGDVVTQNAGGKPPKNERYLVYDLANPHHSSWATPKRTKMTRFTFGTTIENCITRLWFLSHATLLRTKPFDFMKDHHVVPTFTRTTDSYFSIELALKKP
ncbi:hypothetical protein F5050DRAFT_1824001 [Lentinula boryana]|uniref:Uncharacterized protein n=1 Tax=Lentinula boryana TaxID=40481 RepID=A0ABQ8QBJ4_9AGAR|nr:hypothetical protein F5050DRAFT_1824001 [Lentinula boryana]